jgi:hypothetical protein
MVPNGRAMVQTTDAGGCIVDDLGTGEFVEDVMAPPGEYGHQASSHWVQ